MDNTTEQTERKWAAVKQWIEKYDLYDAMYRICKQPNADEIMLGILEEAIAKAEAEAPLAEAEAKEEAEAMAKLKESIKACRRS